MENPCSYKSVRTILDQIQKGTCESRKWTIAGCDGSPYVLGSRLIESSCKCYQCYASFSDRDSIKKHLRQMHELPEAQCSLSKCMEYGNILLVPGPGHFQINMAKACFKLFWHVFLTDLAFLLGFKTPKAQTCCQMATNHHKAMQIIGIALFGFTDELVVPYC